MSAHHPFQYDLVDGVFVDAWNDGRDRDDRPIPPESLETCWAEILLMDAFKLCGCIDAGVLLTPVAQYLRGDWGTYGDSIIHFVADDPFQLLVAHSCCEGRLTEHGGNIGGSWLTERGKRWLHVYTRDLEGIER
jgi:hypothetical protein